MHWQTSVIIIRRLLIKYRTLYRGISYSGDADTVVGGPKCHSVPRHGMRFYAIFIPDYNGFHYERLDEKGK